jgi:hypothetical protein
MPESNEAGLSTSDRDRVAELERKIADLERRVPLTGILAPDFLRRAFTVWGHYFVANLIIGLCVAAVFGFFFVLLLGLGLQWG